MRLRVIDTETCGVAAPDLQIVQIAFSDLVSASPDGNGPDWSIANPSALRREWLVNPGRAIPFDAMGVHHVTDKMVSREPIAEDVLPLIFDGAVAGMYAAHNAAYDIKVVDAALPGMPSKFTWLCTYKAAVTLWPDAPSHKNQVLRYFLGLELGDNIAPHSALGDVTVTAAIAQRVLREISLEHWIAISSRPVLLRRVHFGEHAKKVWEDVPLSYLEWIIYKSKGEWDPDVLHTAKHWHAIKTRAQRSRGPQMPGPY